MIDAYAAAAPDLYTLTLSFKGAAAALRFHFVGFVDAKSAYDTVQQARRAREAALLTPVEIADHFGGIAEIDASAVAACVLAQTARTLEAALERSIVEARIEAKLQWRLRRDPVLRAMVKARQARRPPFRTDSRSNEFAEEPRTCRFR